MKWTLVVVSISQNHDKRFIAKKGAVIPKHLKCPETPLKSIVGVLRKQGLSRKSLSLDR